jgi:HSP20 family protein
MNSEQYFENLAHGKTNATDGVEDDARDDGAITDSGAESAVAENEMGNYEAGEGFEVELAKAATSAVTARHAKATRASSAAKEDAREDEYAGEPEGQLTVDVYQTPDEIVIESAIAGVKPEDIDVNVTSDSISIRGARRHEEKVPDGDYLYQECYWGRFARSIILPQEIDPESAEVAFKNGILTIRLPKANKKKSKKLRVRID